MKKFDLIVVGTGAAGSTVAHKYKKATEGTVAIIDSRKPGGTCALRGCNPKKVLYTVAEAYDYGKRLQGKGINSTDFEINWEDLIEYKEGFIKKVPKGTKKGFKKADIEFFSGKASFASENQIKVKEETLQSEKIVIASGARPRPLDIPGSKLITLSDKFLDLKKLPDEIVFIGGGFVSFEFAHIAARAGAKVTILERGSSPLSHFDQDLVKLLVDYSKKVGIEVILNTEVKKVEKKDKQFVVSAKSNGKEREFKAGLVVHGAGRIPNVSGLEPKSGKVKVGEQGGIAVNEYFQSVSNSKVYSVGDSAESGLPLTPIAEKEASILAKNLIEGENRYTVDYKGTVSVVFTLPPLASVGLTEKQAEEQGLDCEVNFKDTHRWMTSLRPRVKASGFKVLVEKDTNKILGAHLLGHHAEEVINIFALAIRMDARVEDLKPIPWGYPTSSSDISYMF